VVLTGLLVTSLSAFAQEPGGAAPPASAGLPASGVAQVAPSGNAGPAASPALPPVPKLADLPPDQFYGEDVQPCVPIDKSADILDLNDRFAAPRVNIVETNHFIPVVEQLIRGQTAPLPRDIAFVLRNIPNHYRALNAMSRWQATNKIPDDPDVSAPIWSAGCYYQRAIDWRPTDYRLRLMYANHLQKHKRYAEARAQFVRVEAMGFESADVYYNRGLLELDAGDLKAAQAFADKAYALGYPLPGLRNRLDRALAGEGADGPRTTPRKSAPKSNAKGAAGGSTAKGTADASRTAPAGTAATVAPSR
jgi:uncharacterized protein (TIGR02996 family)